MALGGHPKPWNKAPHLSEPHSWHSWWEWAQERGLWSAQVPDMHVLVPTGDPVGIPGWDSPHGVPLASPSPGVPAFIYCAKDKALFALQGAHQEALLSPQEWAVMSFLPNSWLLPPSRAGRGSGALVLKEYLQWLLAALGAELWLGLSQLLAPPAGVPGAVWAGGLHRGC